MLAELLVADGLAKTNMFLRQTIFHVGSCCGNCKYKIVIRFVHNSANCANYDFFSLRTQIAKLKNYNSSGLIVWKKSRAIPNNFLSAVMKKSKL